MKRYRFHREARIEARSAATWYRDRSREVARAFTAELTAAILSIRERPEAWPTWHRADLRRRVLHTHPYSVFYLLEEDEITILAVAHHKRRPGYWLPRLIR
ncbi:MAG: type II toxin-antitoxin system RelE/ParE family toxin [Kofleriaceae bacterium]